MSSERPLESRTGGRAATTGVIPGDFAISVGNPGTALAEGWTWTLLTDVARLETGHTPSRKHPEYWGGNVPWVGIRDATGNHGQTIRKTAQYTNELGIRNSSARILPAHTVCLSRTASVGYVVVMGVPMATSQDFVNWVCGPELDYRFLKYILLGERSSFLRFASGTTHQTIYFPEVKAFHAALPDLDTQRAVADVLSALDDRITLLHDTNATLEAIAQALFKSWFVDFDPVRAKMAGRAPEGMDEATAGLFPDALEEMDLQVVPEGWRYRSLKEVVEIFDSKRVPLSGAERLKRRGPYPYYGAAALMDHVDDYLFNGVYLLTGEDGSVADEAGFPITQYVWGKFWVNNHAHVLQGRNGVATEHVMLSLRHTNIQPFITGAVQAKLSQSNMWRIQFLLPPPSICVAFGEMLRPLFTRVRHNSDMVQTLSNLRDTLLPRLISGQLRLPEARGQLEEALA
ncbi:restriction endonuclease subunit S [uncultured Pseudacidovorax sp.]|uniref:restriction endonuclease subunit S n=1 Tax=uncultured Pseudacidovorax sp. TaxID=679313 RepID=UPI0025D6CDAA|nr:restriction endonuclease subunit S [uncultured Pseudacidovorax sp.]